MYSTISDVSVFSAGWRHWLGEKVLRTVSALAKFADKPEGFSYSAIISRKGRGCRRGF